MCQSQQNRVCRGRCCKRDLRRVLLSAGARCGAIRNKIASAADGVANKTKGASSRPGRGHLPVAEFALWRNG